MSMLLQHGHICALQIVIIITVNRFCRPSYPLAEVSLRLFYEFLSYNDKITDMAVLLKYTLRLKARGRSAVELND